MNVLRTIQPLRPPKPSRSLKCLERYLSTIPSLPPELQPIIGLEIHVQLKTRRKLFSCTPPPPLSLATSPTACSNAAIASQCVPSWDICFIPWTIVSNF